VLPWLRRCRCRRGWEMLASLCGAEQPPQSCSAAGQPAAQQLTAALTALPHAALHPRGGKRRGRGGAEAHGAAGTAHLHSSSSRPHAAATRPPPRAMADTQSSAGKKGEERTWWHRLLGARSGQHAPRRRIRAAAAGGAPLLRRGGGGDGAGCPPVCSSWVHPRVRRCHSRMEQSQEPLGCRRKKE
jgi:hypothetical protein